jgi:hypothetical protein
LQLRRIADEARLVIRLGAQFLVLAAQAVRLRCPGNEVQQMVRLERFFDEIVSTALDGGNGGFNIAVPADDDDRQMRMLALDDIRSRQHRNRGLGNQTRCL